jgi:hypothetical protein
VSFSQNPKSQGEVRSSFFSSLSSLDSKPHEILYKQRQRIVAIQSNGDKGETSFRIPFRDRLVYACPTASLASLWRDSAATDLAASRKATAEWAGESDDDRTCISSRPRRARWRGEEEAEDGVRGGVRREASTGWMEERFDLGRGDMAGVAPLKRGAGKFGIDPSVSSDASDSSGSAGERHESD